MARPLDLDGFLSALQADREPVASEIAVLQSIYGDVRLSHGALPTIRYQVLLNLPAPHDSVPLTILVSVPPSYPASSPPQLQLLSRYIGPYATDSDLFAAILRMFISVNGVQWTPDSVCVFDGLQSAIERCTAWYESRLSAAQAGEITRKDERDTQQPPAPLDDRPALPPSLPEGIDIVEADAIVDRKSSFIGRACRLSHPSQVPLVLAHLMSDRRTARAAHPIIHAWRCQVGPLLHQDNDDDGESAAGGRLAHLLQILEVTNVLVVVTRHFGGTHLGSDRFKHINQAARTALELGGFLDDAAKKHTGRGKKR